MVNLKNLKKGDIYLGISESKGDFYRKDEKEITKWGEFKVRPLLILDIHEKTELVKVVCSTTKKIDEKIIILVENDLSKKLLPFRFKIITTRWIHYRQLKKYIWQESSYDNFKIIERRCNGWYHTKKNRKSFETSLKNGTYSNLSIDQQEYNRTVAQFEEKEQFYRWNKKLEKEVKELKELKKKYLEEIS